MLYWMIRRSSRRSRRTSTRAGPAVHPGGVLFAADVLKFRYRLGYESLCAEVSAKAAALAAALAAAGLRDPAAGRRRGRLRRAGQ